MSYSGLTVEEAWHALAVGDVVGHNQLLAEAIRRRLDSEEVGCVVLAQLSMTVFLLSYPDPLDEFGVPVFTSGQCGFEFIHKFWSKHLEPTPESTGIRPEMSLTDPFHRRRKTKNKIS